jgi:hypothetical protein
MITDFEGYLLSKMRAKSLVEETLAEEGLTRDYLMSRACRAIQSWHLDRLGYDAGVYADAIGRPVEERALSASEVGQVFAGSIQRLYRLHLWPKVLFRVNQHPSGYAWGEGFVQSSEVPRDPMLIRPWEWTDAAIESAASAVEIIERWNHEKDIRVSFGESDHPKIYEARFDFDLLQEWIRVETCSKNGGIERESESVLSSGLIRTDTGFPP